MKIWIFNHYATNMFFSGGGRHQWFAKYLIRKGYDVEIFCANTLHHDKSVAFDLKNELYSKRIGLDSVKYCFIKASSYSGNGVGRIKNMLSFYVNVKNVCKKRFQSGDRPDIILASSVHPLSLVAGIQLGKKYRVPCICEIRDLWPYTLVQFEKLKKGSFITRLLYEGERWIYKNADKLIFTMKGGSQYIVDQKWEGEIDLEKVYYINNGVDLETFLAWQKEFDFSDEDLDSDTFKVIYAGAMGEPNQIEQIIKAAKDVKQKGYNDIQFILYGEGLLRHTMERKCGEERLDNVTFKGKVEKQKIPYILSKGNFNILTIKESKLYDYGISMNKLFDYLASGKPIVCNNQCVDSVLEQSPCRIINENLTEGILLAYHMKRIEYSDMCYKAAQVARNYDYKKLTEKLISIIEGCLLEYDGEQMEKQSKREYKQIR